jgi:outer membrane protein, heavy metal efflux system
MATRIRLQSLTARAAAALLWALPTLLAGQSRPAADGLTLQQVYTLASARNPTLQAAHAATRAAAARESSAGLLPDPQLQVGVMNASLPDLGLGMPTSMAPAVQLMQMVPTAGKLALSGRIARQETAIARTEAEERWWEVRSRAAMAFYEIYSADRQLAVMRETVQLLESFAQVARAMYAAGSGRQSDVLRASVEVARMEGAWRRTPLG